MCIFINTALCYIGYYVFIPAHGSIVNKLLFNMYRKWVAVTHVGRWPCIFITLLIAEMVRLGCELMKIPFGENQ